MQEFQEILQTSLNKLTSSQDHSQLLHEFLNQFPENDQKITTKVQRQKLITETINFVLNLNFDSYTHAETVVFFFVSALKQLEEQTKQNFFLEIKSIEAKLESEIIKVIKSNDSSETHAALMSYLSLSSKTKQESIFSASILYYLKKNLDSNQDLSFYLKLLLEPEFEALEYKEQLVRGFSHTIFKRYSGMLVNPKSFPKQVIKLDLALTSDQDSIIQVDYNGKVSIIEQFFFDLNVLLRLNQTKSQIKLKGLKYNISSNSRFFSIFYDYFGKPLHRYFSRSRFVLADSKLLFILKQIILETLNLVEKKIFIDFVHPCNVFVSKNRVNVLPKVYFAKYYNNLMGEIEIQSFCHEDPDQRLTYSIALVFLYMKNPQSSNSLNLNGTISKLKSPIKEFIASLSNSSLSLSESLSLLKTLPP